MAHPRQPGFEVSPNEVLREIRELRRDATVALVEISHIKREQADAEEARKTQEDRIRKIEWKVYGFVATVVATMGAFVAAGVA